MKDSCEFGGIEMCVGGKNSICVKCTIICPLLYTPVQGRVSFIHVQILVIHTVSAGVRCGSLVRWLLAEWNLVDSKGPIRVSNSPLRKEYFGGQHSA